MTTTNTTTDAITTTDTIVDIGMMIGTVGAIATITTSIDTETATMIAATATTTIGTIEIATVTGAVGAARTVVTAAARMERSEAVRTNIETVTTAAADGATDRLAPAARDE